MLSKHIVYVLFPFLAFITPVSTYIASIYAADINATITTGSFAPLSPLNLTVSIEDERVDLSWSAPSSDGGSAITDYVIEYQLTSGGSWTVFSDGVSTISTTTVTGLINDTSYDFRVSAVNAIGQGSPSAVVSASPGAPAQVLIVQIGDTIIPSITASVRITNEGGGTYTYPYSWCVTNSDANLCGGGDDVFSASGSKVLLSGETWNTDLSAVVTTAGNYWFHLEVDFGSDSSHASQSFTAVAESSGGSSSGGGQSSKRKACVGADANRDKIVNLVDFSILLMFFNTTGPFPNPCADINRDNKINVIDFSIMLSQWGKKPIVITPLP